MKEKQTYYERNRTKGEENLEKWALEIIEKFRLRERRSEFDMSNEMLKCVDEKGAETIFEFVVKEFTPELPSIFYTELTMPTFSIRSRGRVDTELFNVGWPILKRRILKKLDQ